MCADRVFRIGFLVNPIAGMGGSVGLHGTDGAATLEEARRRGAREIAAGRARRGLDRLRLLGSRAHWLAGPGALGEDVARDAGLATEVVGPRCDRHTTGENMRACAAAMHWAGVDLLLFAGGDGTARDVYAAVADAVPILGIPAGVKMHSAVFATNPEHAGEVVHLALAAGLSRLREAEVMDCDEAERRQGRLGARLFGVARTPYVPRLVQHAKAGALSAEAALDASCRQIGRSLEPGWVHIVGPGTSAKKVLAALGIEGTLAGVDAVRDGELIGADLAEAAILRLIEGRPARIIVGIVGGQGFVLGRGNQPISARVIQRVGRDNITVIGSLEKLVALEGRPLLVDTGDSELDASLAGFMRVAVAPDHAVLYRIAS